MNVAAVALAVPALLAALLVALLRRSSWAARLADHPNHRSLHTAPTPRIGGIAMLLAALPLAMGLAGDELMVAWALALGLGLVSLADDLRSLPIAVRLAAHFAAAAIVVAWLPAARGEHGLVAAIAAMLAIAWMTNLYNFMDGADGLAGIMAAIGFGAYALAALGAHMPGLALGCAALASAACGFLAFNLPPAKVFMGDAGAIPLGFLAGALGAFGAASGAWPAWFPLLVFSPFIVDASVTIARRLARRERVWIAHRSHYYQRLVLCGWSHRRLAAAFTLVAAAAAASALAARTAEAGMQYAILAGWCAAYVIAMLAVERRAAAASASS